MTSQDWYLLTTGFAVGFLVALGIVSIIDSGRKG